MLCECLVYNAAEGLYVEVERWRRLPDDFVKDDVSVTLTALLDPLLVATVYLLVHCQLVAVAQWQLFLARQERHETSRILKGHIKTWRLAVDGIPYDLVLCCEGS